MTKMVTTILQKEKCVLLFVKLNGVMHVQLEFKWLNNMRCAPRSQNHSSMTNRHAEKSEGSMEAKAM